MKRLRLPTWSLLLVPLLGLAELGAAVYDSERAPGFEDWQVLVEPITKTKKDNELIVVAPSYGDPLARKTLGDALMPLRDVARSDVDRYSSALEISFLGERSPELQGFTQVEQKKVGKFTVYRMKNPQPEQITFDFLDAVDPAHADVRGTDPPVDCPFNPNAKVLSGGLGGHPTFPKQRFECPAGEFFNVGVTVIADQDFLPRRCIWSHPPRRGEVITTFHDVPLGKTIQGHHGMYWIIERPLTGAPVKLTVRVDGEDVGSIEHIDGQGWAPFSFDLGKLAGTTAKTVAFAVSSPNYKDRHYCFEASSRQ